MHLKRYYDALESKVNKYIVNRKDFKTDRRIVVFESDDWGSVRMPSKYAYDFLLKRGIPVNRCTYNSYDCLASKEDMSFLFELLYHFKDKNGNPPIITANSIVANPDFAKIKASNYKEYFYEPLPKTLRERTNNSIELWHEGIARKVFYPQYHGREHLNVRRWLRYLQEGSAEFRIAFELGMFGISTTISKENRPTVMAALAIDDIDDIIHHKSILEDGYQLFKQIFKYNSESFIAPNYIWHKKDEDCLSKLGIKFLGGALVQNEPVEGKTIHRIYHFTGERNQFGQLYLVRNCFFEPSTKPSLDWVNLCLTDIRRAFNHNRPAIICSHRVNFIGSIDVRNRDRNLRSTKELLENITVLWPDVEFMTSNQLGKLIMEKSDENLRSR